MAINYLKDAQVHVANCNFMQTVSGVEGSSQDKFMGGVCDHITHFGCHIEVIRLLKAWGGAAMLKGPGENSGVGMTYAPMHSSTELGRFLVLLKEPKRLARVLMYS